MVAVQAHGMSVVTNRDFPSVSRSSLATGFPLTFFLHVRVLLAHCWTPQQFIRDNVLCVDADGGEDEEIAAAQRDLRRCPVHQVVDRTLNDANLDCAFDAIGEDDKVMVYRRLGGVTCFFRS